MGIRNILGIAPEWVGQLPPHTRPDAHQVSQLEEVRKRLELRHDEFAFFIASRPATTKKVQLEMYRLLKEAHPRFNERDLLAEVLKSRLVALGNAGDPWLTDEREFECFMEKITTFDDLCNAIIGHDLESEGIDTTGWAKERVDQILEQ
jgi:hypothetical protein